MESDWPTRIVLAKAAQLLQFSSHYLKVRIVLVAALAGAAACGGGAKKNPAVPGKLLDQQTFTVGGTTPSSVQLGTGDQAATVSFPTDATQTMKDIQVALSSDVKKMGATPVNNTVIQIITINITFVTPAVLQMALPPPAQGQVYMGATATAGAAAWTIVGPARLVGPAPTLGDAGTSNWQLYEVDIQRTGIWTIVLVGKTHSGGSAGGSAGGSGGGGQAGFGIEGEMAYDEFGSSLDLSNDGMRVVIGARVNDAAGTSAGHMRVFQRSGDNWIQLGADLDGEAADDRFGTSVAISANGTRIAGGAYLNDGGGVASGSARVYDYVGGVWTQVGATIYGAANDAIGWTLDLSADGNRLVVGGSTPNSLAGRARVYDLVAGAWTQVGATLADSYEFGDAVSISADGKRIAVSQTSAFGTTRPGTVYVYDWNGTSWAMVGGALVGEAVGDLFGSALSLSADGSMIAIGADNNVGSGVSGGGAKGGHVRVFRLTAGTWTQVGADIDGPQALPSGGSFGQSVSLSADGTRLISAGNGGGKASIGIYNLSGSTWTKSTAPDFGTGGRLGAVSISADGGTVAIGEVYFRGAAGAATGVVRIYALP